MYDKIFNSRNVWRICNKICAAIFRIKEFNLYEIFKPFDPHNTNLIKESEFISIFAKQLRQTIGLSDQEIGDLTDYFRIQDGRIYYKELCEIIHQEPNFDKNPDFITGLEWEDPMHENCLNASEKRQFHLIITKIATIVNQRQLDLLPYFEDYELIANNFETITITHFARILSFLKISVTSSDFNLLVKKYLKDGYTVNYMAFIKDINKTIVQIRNVQNGLTILPRPEIERKSIASVFGEQNVFHPIFNGPYEQEALQTVIRRIQRHVLENRIRIKQFFEGFDRFNCGRCTTAQFRRAIDSMGISRLGRLYISPYEFELLSIQYRDPTDPNRICYDVFETDIESVFTTRQLEKDPNVKIDVPPNEVVELPKKGAKNWNDVSSEAKDLCEETLMKIKEKVLQRSISLIPLFKDYDKHNMGHVSRAQVRQILCSNCILLTNSEIFALEQRYNDSLGFNYLLFLKELDNKKIEEPLFNNYLEVIKKINVEQKPMEAQRYEKDLVHILAKIKAKITSERIQILQFLQQYDPNNVFCIPKADFKRGLDVCKFDLTETEYETIMNVFANTLRPDYVDYRKFVEVIEEESLEGVPSLEGFVPLQHVPTRDSWRNFLNFDDRVKVAPILERLAKLATILELRQIFKQFDQQNCGTITKNQFSEALDMAGLLRKITNPEFNVLCKCFVFARGLRNEIDYRAFCLTLEVLFESMKEKPF